MKNEHKELYRKYFPQYLMDLLDKPRDLNTVNNKSYFIMCTDVCVKENATYNRVLYHTLYLAFVY